MAKANVALGTLIGAVAGFVTGVLVAPKSGAETRNDIKNGAIKAKDTSLGKIDEAKEKASNVADDVAEKAKSVVGDVSGKAKSVTKDVTARAEEVKGRVERAVEGAQKGFTPTPKAQPKTTKKK